jgi:stress-induced morphogen
MTLFDEIKEKLENELPGSIVQVESQSSQHIGHDAGGAHVKVSISYAKFKDIGVVEQHQMVYEALKEEMKSKIHALVISTKVI